MSNPVIPITNASGSNTNGPDELFLGEIASNRTSKKIFLGADSGVVCVGEDVNSVARGGTGATSAPDARVNLGIYVDWTTVTENTVLIANNKYIADSSLGSFTLTLPDGPSVGTEVWIQDSGENWATNNVDVISVNENINGQATTLVLDIDNAAVLLTYVGGSLGWDIKNISGQFTLEGLTPELIGALSTAQLGGIVVASTQLAAYALTSQISGFDTTQLNAYVPTSQLGGLVVTSTQLEAYALTSQISSFDTTQLNAYIPTSQLGAINGVAELNGSGYLKSTQIPGLVGDVVLAAGSTTTTIEAIGGFPIDINNPTSGQVLQWNGTSFVAGTNPTGGSGGGGVVYYFNYNTAAQSPTTGLPTTPTTPKKLARFAEVTATSVTSASLSEVTYDLVCSFVTDVSDPYITTIPAGLFDFNIWASSNANTSNQTIIQLKVYKYDGTTATLLATSNDLSIYDPTVVAQYTPSINLPQTSVDINDRLYIEILAKATANNRTITIHFGGGYSSHVHTTVPSVGGTGLVKVIDGVFQSPASLLVDNDIATNAEIAISKISGLTAALSSKLGTSDTVALSQLAQSSATTEQFLGWSGTSWSPTAITTAQITGFTSALASKLGTSDTVALTQLAQSAATTGQFLGWAGTSWSPTTITTTQISGLSSGFVANGGGANTIRVLTSAQYNALSPVDPNTLYFIT
jgi:hypothetical protein